MSTLTQDGNAAERRARLRGLYVILDPQVAADRDLREIARQAILGGARVLQLRDKLHDKGEQLPLARALQRLCRQAGVPFLVNDHVDLALACAADGVHLGQKDLPIEFARRVLPPQAIVGASTNTVAEALRAQEAGADYVAVGRLFPTTSKEDTRPVTPDTLRQVRQSVQIPVVGIGGINEANIDGVLQAGADMVAVIGAVVGALDVREAAQRLARHFSL